MTTLRERVRADHGQLEIWTTSERLDRAFEDHRTAHPEVYGRLLVLARHAKELGWRRIGIGFLWERMRFEFGPHERDAAGFACNNSLRSRYARALVRENPELEGLFEMRKLKAV